MRDLWKLRKTSMDKNRSDLKYFRLYELSILLHAFRKSFNSMLF